LLPDPDPVEGFKFRWIRASSLGNLDNSNVSTRMREGWVPCKAEDHPEMKLLEERNSRFPGAIEVGGLILCKATVEQMAPRAEYHEKMNRGQLEAVDNNLMRVEDPRMPIFSQKSSSTSFGKGLSKEI